MGRKQDHRLPEAFWHVSQGGMTVVEACEMLGLARTSLYRYKPFQDWRNSIKAR